MGSLQEKGTEVQEKNIEGKKKTFQNVHQKAFSETIQKKILSQKKIKVNLTLRDELRAFTTV